MIVRGNELQSKKHCRSNWEMVLEENRSAIRKQLPMLYHSYNVKKDMKIPKGQSESIYMHRRRTDTTIAKINGLAWHREARGSNQDQSRVINMIIYFSKY